MLKESVRIDIDVTYGFVVLCPVSLSVFAASQSSFSHSVLSLSALSLCSVIHDTGLDVRTLGTLLLLSAVSADHRDTSEAAL